MNKFDKNKYLLERLTDPWINHSLARFIEDVTGGGYNDYDGFGEPYFVNKKTLKIEDCNDSLDLNLFVRRDNESVSSVIERLHKEFDTEDRYLMGVFWYNK